jgi:hypothetical protein
MEGKGTPETHLDLASYRDEQVVLLPLDIVDYIVEKADIVEKAEGKRPEEAAVQRGHLAAQFPGEHPFQDHQDQDRRDQGHLAL